MTDEQYLRLMLVAASCLLATGLILAIVKTPTDMRAQKFGVAKHGLTVAMLVLGVMNLVQIGFDPVGNKPYLGSSIALAVSYVQAMIFTNAVVVLVSPNEVTLRRLLWQLGAIVGVDMVLEGSYLLLPLHVFFYVYGLCIVLYVLLLAAYTRWFLRCYRRFKEQIADYYEEEETERGLRWLGVLFWAALVVGVLSLLMLLGHRDIDACLSLVAALFYVFLAACFINYQLSSPLIMPVLSKKSLPAEVPISSDAHPDRLMGWIERCGYLQTDKAVEDIAGELEMSLSQFHQYFGRVIGEDFRTWRVRKRVEHARQLMKEHPNWPVTRVAQASGFNDRSYFYQQFKRVSGMTVTAYKKNLGN